MTHEELVAVENWLTHESVELTKKYEAEDRILTALLDKVREERYKQSDKKEA
jgi:hypothetical protein